MRDTNGVYYLHGDHLSSTSLVTDEDGDLYASRRYRPYGEPRPLSGTLPTDRTYTDQRDEPSLGIIDYRARYYSARLGRFLSADTIVPDPANPQSLNRYSYVNNRPLNFVDPSGRLSNEHIMELFGVDEWESVLAEFRPGGSLQGRWGFLKMLTKLSGPGEWITGPSEMARLYAVGGTRSTGYALPGDELLMTVSAGKVNGQWTLLEHLADGSSRPVSVFDVGQLEADVWVGGTGGKWSGPSGIDYGHGLLAGKPGTTIYTLAPDKFDAWGAGLDAVGILGDLSGTPTGAAVAGVSDVVSVYRSGWALAQAARGGAPSPEVRSAVVDFAVDLASFRWNYWPDMLSLYLNFRSATYTDVIR